MRNLYFSHDVKSEQNLYEDLIIESMQINGEDVYYLPRKIVNIDKIFVDDIPSTFDESHVIEMYIENVDGFSGEGDIFSKFGIEIRDQATFIVSKKRWEHVTRQHKNVLDHPRPAEGDLIYLPLSKSIFQIMRVEHEQPFYQLSNLPIYVLECELFEYNDEDFDTSIPVVDAIETTGYEFRMKLDSTSSDYPIVIGDTITQSLPDGTQIKGEIIGHIDSSNEISVTHIGANDGEFHMFTDSSDITFTATGDVRNIISSYEDVGDEWDQNDVFDTEVDFIDFTEKNPFGDPS